MIDYFRLNIEYLRFASLRAIGSALYEPEAGGSILKRPIKKLTERSDYHKYSIDNLQSSILVFSGGISRVG